MFVSKGVPSLNDEVLFGVVPAPIDYCNLYDLTGDCDLDIDDFLLLIENWVTQRGFLNESFEDDVVTDGSFVQIDPGDTLTGWDNNIVTGEYVRIVNPLATDTLQTVDGDNYILFSSFFADNIANWEGGHEANGNSFHDIRIAENTTYTVTVKVANPTAFNGAYNLQLVALDDFGGLVITPLQSSVGDVFAGSGWSTASVSWNSSMDPTVLGDRLLFSMSGYDYAADDVIFIISGDYTQDGFINLEDFAVLASHWLDN
jgi:hypothetical protein